MRDYLARLRKEAGMSQVQVAEYLGYSKSGYANLENGNRPSDLGVLVMRKIANVFGLPPADVFRLECEYQDSRHNAKPA